MSNIVHTIKLVTSAQAAIAEIGKYQDQISGCAQTVEKYTNTLSGDKIFKSANEWTAAVAKLGGATDGLASSEQLLAGASKLTWQEKDKLNRTVTEAIEKYEALGQKAPAAMLELQQATTRAGDATETAGQKATFFDDQWKKIASAVSAGAIFDRVIAGLVNFGKEAIADAGHLVDLAQKTGLSTDALQVYGEVARESGSTTDDVAQAVFKLGVAIDKGEKAVTGQNGALEKLGLSYAEIQRLSPEQQFEVIAQKLGTVEGAQERNRIGVDLFGKTWATVAPAIVEGIDSVKSHTVIASEESLKQVDAMADRWDRFVHNSLARVENALGRIIALSDHDKTLDKLKSDLKFWEDYSDRIRNNTLAWYESAANGEKARTEIAKLTLEIRALTKATDTGTSSTHLSVEQQAKLDEALRKSQAAAKLQATEVEALTRQWAAHIKPLTDTHVILGQIEKRLPDVSVAWRKVEDTFASSAGGIKTIMADTRTHVIEGWKDQRTAAEKAATLSQAAQEKAFKAVEKAHDDMVRAIENASVKLIDGAIHGWDSLKDAAKSIGEEILQYYEHVFVKKMLEYFGLMEGGGVGSFGKIAGASASTASSIALDYSSVAGSSSTAAAASSSAWAASFATAAASSISWAATAYIAWQWYRTLISEHVTPMPPTSTPPSIPGTTAPPGGGGSGNSDSDWAQGLAYAQLLWDQASATGWAYGSDAFYSWMNQHPEYWNHGQGFREGTRGEYVDFGAGTPVWLHGKERVMTESEGKRSGTTVNIYNPVVREDRDIDRLTDQIARRLDQRGF